MRTTLLLLVLLPAFGLGQSNIDDAYAHELIERLENDPQHERFLTDIQLIFRWMDESADLPQLMSHPGLIKLAKRRRDYREQMQILYLAGIVRYLSLHPELAGNSKVQLHAKGLSCMCIGYANLRKSNRVGPDRFLQKVCKNR